MSSNEEPELKGGHPPAVKAGGMRVARTHHSSTGESAAAAKVDPEEQQEYADPATKDDKVNINVSGALGKGDSDFPPEAVKLYHDKPVPTNVNRQAGHQTNQQQNRNINQPR